MYNSDNNQTPVVKVRNSNSVLVYAIQKSRESKTVIIRGYGSDKKRILDTNVNPLVTITDRDFQFLITKKILRDLGHDNLYEFNQKIKIEAA